MKTSADTKPSLGSSSPVTYAAAVTNIIHKLEKKSTQTHPNGPAWQNVLSESTPLFKFNIPIVNTLEEGLFEIGNPPDDSPFKQDIAIIKEVLQIIGELAALITQDLQLTKSWTKAYNEFMSLKAANLNNQYLHKVPDLLTDMKTKHGSSEDVINKELKYVHDWLNQFTKKLPDVTTLKTTPKSAINQHQHFDENSQLVAISHKLVQLKTKFPKQTNPVESVIDERNLAKSKFIPQRNMEIPKQTNFNRYEKERDWKFHLIMSSLEDILPALDEALRSVRIFELACEEYIHYLTSCSISRYNC